MHLLPSRLEILGDVFSRLGHAQQVNKKKVVSQGWPKMSQPH